MKVENLRALFAAACLAALVGWICYSEGEEAGERAASAPAPPKVQSKADFDKQIDRLASANAGLIAGKNNLDAGTVKRVLVQHMREMGASLSDPKTVDGTALDELFERSASGAMIAKVSRATNVPPQTVAQILFDDAMLTSRASDH